MKSSTLLLSCILSAAFSASAFADSPVREVHLIHHSHTDIGYTDLISTSLDLHVDFIRQALDFADATKEFPDDARFRWTCESALVVERFLQSATANEKSRFDDAVRRGQFEVAAMPHNLTGLSDAAEWNAVVKRIAPLWKTYGSRVAMQNDVNGFPWGLLPSLREHGIDTIWMGPNLDTSVPLSPTPDAFWWEGPDGKRSLVWLGKAYGDGFFWFHDSEWRRGPVPSATDVWYNPPSPSETWLTTKENLEAAQQILNRKLASVGHYQFPAIAVQVTNMWRIDNDPPSRQIADFVKAWNEAGRQPKLVMSTPTRFLARLHETAGDKITTVRRGDWQDWWNDGITTTPELLIANARAKRILADLPAAASLLANPKAVEHLPLYDRAWYDAIFFDEHTWGSYNSIAQPYHLRTLGGIAQKADFAYRAAEEAALARTNMFRGAKDYCDLSRTRMLRVLNPGTAPRSGWVDISATAIRFPCNAVREVAGGKIYPLEDLRQPEWSEPDLRTAPFDIPNDAWGWQVKHRRFFLSNVKPGQAIDFELVQTDLNETAKKTPKNGLAVRWDEKTGRMASLSTADGRELIDASAAHGMGQIVVERLKDRGQRFILGTRDPRLLSEQFIDEPAKLVEAKAETTAYASRLSTVWEHPLFHRVEQHWDVFNESPRAELTTTIWTRETADPCAVYLAMPLSVPNAKFVYDSAGYPTVFSDDTMPGTNAETIYHGGGLLVRGPSSAILLGTPETPLGCVGGPALRRRIVAPYAPPNSHYYINALNDYWHTNFSIVKAGKLVIRQWIEPADSKQASLSMLSDELWAYPIQPK